MSYRRAVRWTGAGLAALVGCLLQYPAVAQSTGTNTASLDYCADQYVLALAEPAQIVALSPDATAPHSFYADKAVGLPTFGASTEEVVMLRPDALVRYWGGNPKMFALADRLGIRVASARFGSDQETLYWNIRTVASALGRDEIGEGLIRDIEARYVALEAAPATDLTALYVTPSGTTAGVGTFVDDLMSLAGIEGVAKRWGLQGWQTIPAEQLLLDPPDVIITAFFDMRTRHESLWGIGRHDAITRLIQSTPIIDIPGRYVACDGFFFVDAAELIREKANALNLSGGSQ